MEFQGIPLVGQAVLDALQVDKITEVYISTDDPEIEKVAVKYGAKSLGLRPKNLASDNSLANETYRYMIDLISSAKGVQIQELVIIQPTSPLRLPVDIENSIDLYLEKKADSVISFTEQNHPISWYKSVDSDKKILLSKYKAIFSNRQDEPVLYIPNGAVYILSKKVIFSDSWYSENTFAHIMPKERSIDIDDISDFDFAIYLAKKLGIDKTKYLVKVQK